METNDPQWKGTSSLSLQIGPVREEESNCTTYVRLGDMAEDETWLTQTQTVEVIQELIRTLDPGLQQRFRTPDDYEDFEIDMTDPREGQLDWLQENEPWSRPAVRAMVDVTSCLTNRFTEAILLFLSNRDTEALSPLEAWRLMKVLRSSVLHALDLLPDNHLSERIVDAEVEPF